MDGSKEHLDLSSHAAGEAGPNLSAGRAIVIGGFINALGLIRSLAAMGVRVALITTHTYDIAHRSRYVDLHIHSEEFSEHPEQLLQCLQNLPSEWSGAVLYPTTDLSLEILSRHRAELASLFRLVLPPVEAVSFFLDRKKMMQAALESGLKLPHSYGLVSEMPDEHQGIQFPVVIKPVHAGKFADEFGVKLFPAVDSRQLALCRERLAQAGLQGEVFDWIPGPDRRIHSHCVYLGENGEVLAECTVRKLRQTPAVFGVARVAQCMPPIPELSRRTVRLLRDIGHHGFASAEFKWDSRDNTWRFLEMNGRSVVYNSLLRQAGLDIARIAWMDYVKGEASAVTTQVWQGAWINLHADILRSMFQGKNDEAVNLKDYLEPYWRRKIYAVWSLKDPAPFFLQWNYSFRALFSRIFSSGKHAARHQRFLP